MRLCVISDNIDLYDSVTGIIKSREPGLDAYILTTTEEVIRDGKEAAPDIVLIDTSFSGSGFPYLAGMIRSRSARTCIIVISDDDSFAVQAFSVHAAGYIIRPVTESRLTEELNYCLDLLNNTKREQAGVQVMTSGSHDIFLNGIPARFKYNKTGEMLAQLIDRNGASVSNEELIGMLWGEKAGKLDERSLKNRCSYLRNLKADLFKALEAAGCGDAVIKRRGKISANMDRITMI